ncbi:hypothetical protein [Halosquirtibacter laminarini]|uniref:hypothetical protein n=1 Tax=Halosquirtibacter laminarini TaxID=3374600 RepID=UPI003747949D
MVILQSVKSVKGNTNGYQLKLCDTNITIPVSRKYTSDFQTKLSTVVEGIW